MRARYARARRSISRTPPDSRRRWRASPTSSPPSAPSASSRPSGAAATASRRRPSVGSAPATLYRWLDDGEAEGAPLLVADFALAVRQAEAQFEAECVGRIEAAAVGGDWKADAWLLERRHPQRWGRRTSRELTGTLAHEHPIAPVGGGNAARPARRRLAARLRGSRGGAPCSKLAGRPLLACAPADPAGGQETSAAAPPGHPARREPAHPRSRARGHVGVGWCTGLRICSRAWLGPSGCRLRFGRSGTGAPRERSSAGRAFVLRAESPLV